MSRLVETVVVLTRLFPLCGSKQAVGVANSGLALHTIEGKVPGIKGCICLVDGCMGSIT